MSNGEDRIPNWTGRVVTTAEIPSSLNEPASLNEPGSLDEPARGAAEPRAVDPEVESRSGRPLVDRLESPQLESRLRGISWLALGTVLAVIVAAGTGVALLTRSSSVGSSPDPAPPTIAEADDDAAASEASAGRDESTAAAADDTPPTTTAPEANSSVPGPSAAVVKAYGKEARDAGESVWAIVSDGRIYLQGSVPSEESAELMTERLQSILGPNRVEVQYVVDPTSPMPVDPPLFIKETVAFESQTATMQPGSEWILVAADLLLRRYPAATLTVVADPSAAEASGDTTDVQKRRVDAIVEFLAERGVDRLRLNSELREGNSYTDGSEPVHEPLEFVVRGLLEQEASP